MCDYENVFKYNIFSKTSAVYLRRYSENSTRWYSTCVDTQRLPNWRVIDIYSCKESSLLVSTRVLNQELLLSDDCNK